MPVELGSLVISGSKIMMQQPRLAGVTPDNRRYDLTAQIAGQDVTKPEWSNCRASMRPSRCSDESVFETTAQSGHL